MDSSSSPQDHDAFPESPTLPSVIPVNGVIPPELNQQTMLPAQHQRMSISIDEALPRNDTAVGERDIVSRNNSVDHVSISPVTATSSRITSNHVSSNTGLRTSMAGSSSSVNNFLHSAVTQHLTTHSPPSTSPTAGSANNPLNWTRSTPSPPLSFTRRNSANSFHVPSSPVGARSASAASDAYRGGISNNMASRGVPQTSSWNSRRKERDHDRDQKRDRRHEPHKNPQTPPAVPPAPTPAMYWSRAETHSCVQMKGLRAHTANMAGELIYIFGGMDAKYCFDSLYIFDAETMYWMKPEVNGEIPPLCRAHTSTMVDKNMFIFGGGDGPSYYNDLYIFDTVLLEWSKPKVKGTLPSPRRAHSASLYNNSIYVFGGGDGVKALNDTWKLDITDIDKLEWRQIETKGPKPISRGYHTSSIVGSKMIIIGGSDGHECFGDLCILDLEDMHWTIVDMEASFPRLAHTATQVGSYLFVIGGHDGTKYSNEVLLLNLVTMQWETRKVYGIPPSGRGYHAVLLFDSRLFVFGGWDGHNVFEDVYILDLSACAYLPQITNFTIDV